MGSSSQAMFCTMPHKTPEASVLCKFAQNRWTRGRPRQFEETEALRNMQRQLGRQAYPAPRWTASPVRPVSIDPACGGVWRQERNLRAGCGTVRGHDGPRLSEAIEIADWARRSRRRSMRPSTSTDGGSSGCFVLAQPGGGDDQPGLSDHLGQALEAIDAFFLSV